MLKAAPDVEIVSERAETCDGRRIRFSELFYDIPSSGHETLRIFARYARPSRVPGGGLPGLVWVHGGASIGSDEAVIRWASRGFAAISMDLPGKGGEARHGSRSEGPDMSDRGIFTVAPSPANSYLYLCVNAVCRAMSVLAAQPEVDANRLGLLGYSWGGVIVLLANGVDDRVTSACTVYGAGFIHEESVWVEPWIRNMRQSDVRLWARHFDPSSYLESQHGRMLFVSATADSYYPLRSFLRTWRGARCQKALSLALDRNHDLDEPCAAAIVRWFDRTLVQGDSSPGPAAERSDGKLVVRASERCSVSGVLLATTHGADFASAGWDSREVQGRGGVWEVEPPSGDAGYIVTVIDDAGAAFTAAVGVPGIGE